MATITITVPDTLVPRITAAMRNQFPQYSTLTDAGCFKQVTADYWRSVLANYEGINAGNNATNQALSDGSGIG